MITCKRYEEFYPESVNEVENFWTRQASKLHWTKKWDKVLDSSNSPFNKWFVGGQINVCYNLIDKHLLDGNGNKTALYYDSTFTNEKKKYSYYDLQNEVSRAGTVLKNLGVTKGSTVIICLPRIPEAIITALACSRIGAIYTFLFGGFPPRALAAVIQHSKPAVIVTTTVGILEKIPDPVYFKEVLDKAVELAQIDNQRFLIVNRTGLPEGVTEDRTTVNTEQDSLWGDLVPRAETSDCEPMDTNEPLCVCYTSGTTGKPKGVVMSAGRLLLTIAKAEMDSDTSSENAVFFSPKEMHVTPAHHNLIYRGFITGDVALLYEGDLNEEKSLDLLRLVDEYKVSHIITNFRSFIDLKEQIETFSISTTFSFKSLQNIEVGGEVSDVSVMTWLANFLNCSVSSGYGQTEIGSAIGKAVSRDSSKTANVVEEVFPMSGLSVKVIGEDGQEITPGREGRLLLKQPLPPGTFYTIWKDDERYIQDYFTDYPGYYDTKDNVYLYADGSFRVTGRADEVILVAGARIMPSLIEDVILSSPSVHECYVGPIPDEKYGQVPFALYTAKENAIKPDEELDIRAMVTKALGEVIRFAGAIRIPEIPKTGNGKIQRKFLQEHLVKTFQKKAQECHKEE